MRIIDIVKRSNRNLLRSKVRTALTVIAIVIGAFAITLTTAIGQGAQTFISNQTSTLQVKNTFLIVKTPEGEATTSGSGSSTSPQVYNPNKAVTPKDVYIDQSDITKILDTAGITGVTPSYDLTPEYITTPGKAKYVISASSYIQNIAYQVEAGSLPSSTDTGYILLPDPYVSVLGFSNPSEAIGKTVSLTYANFAGKTKTVTDTIKGVLVNSVFVSSSANIDPIEAKSLYEFQNAGSPLLNSFRTVYASYASSYTTSQINSVKQALKTEGYTAETFTDLISSIQSTINIVEVVLSFFAFIAILASTFGITNTLIMSIYERKREIGLMKALGMGRGELFEVFAFEATSIGFWGGAIGVGCAYVVGQITDHILSMTALKDFYHFQLLAFNPTYIILIILFLMLVGFLAGTIPAIRASKLDPIEALREE